VPAIRALAVVLTAWVLVLLAPAGPASAGGPTSALLSAPGEARTASLYYTDDAYDQLASLVGGGGSGTGEGSGGNHDSGTTVTVTWLIHDVEPWRVDRIYLGADDGPWIATQEMVGDATSIWDSPVTWHQPTDGKELIALLDSLGVGQVGAATGTGAVDEPASPVEPGPADPASVEPASAPPADDGPATSARDRAWWALGGLAGGVLLAAGWTRLRSTRTVRRDDDLDRDDAKDWLEPVSR
jgi:hypothetical protein